MIIPDLLFTIPKEMKLVPRELEVSALIMEKQLRFHLMVIPLLPAILILQPLQLVILHLRTLREPMMVLLPLITIL